MNNEPSLFVPMLALCWTLIEGNKEFDLGISFITLFIKNMELHKFYHSYFIWNICLVHGPWKTKWEWNNLKRKQDLNPKHRKKQTNRFGWHFLLDCYFGTLPQSLCIYIDKKKPKQKDPQQQLTIQILSMFIQCWTTSIGMLRRTVFWWSIAS